MIQKLKISKEQLQTLECGFTLSEVLITLSIVGILAAITIPIVMPMIQERVDSHRHSNIVHKITQATDVMKSLGKLGKFSNTDDFVDALEKHLKISKRCDSNHLEDCWPTKTVIGADGDEYNVKDAKTRGALGFKNDKSNPNVGIVLTDGAAIIMTYNSEHEGLDPTDATIASAKELPVGTGTKEFLEYTTNSTAGLAFVVDVNGGKKPNSETINDKMHDIRNLNGATFSKQCGGMKIDSTCYTAIDSYTPLNCSRTGGNTGTLNNSANTPYCGARSNLATDYWAGAQKACADIGASVPSLNSLKNICPNYKSRLGISEGDYWSSDIDGGAQYAYGLDFKRCHGFSGYDSNYEHRANASKKVLCVGG